MTDPQHSKGEKMKVYLIDRINDSFFGYDIYRGHVIIADNESNVRQIASSHAADEGSGVWLDNTKTEVTLLAEESTDTLKCGIVLSDFNAG